MDAVKAKADKTKFAIALVSIGVLYMALAIGTLLTKQPWCDEAFVASPVLNLISEEQHPETSLYEIMGVPFVKEMEGYTYRQMPFGVLAKIAWYKIVGFGLFSTRADAILWGFLALGACFAIVNALSGCRKTALLAVALLSVDYYFILDAADGRVDMMSVSLGFAGIAAYLLLRERNFTSALPVGHTFVMLSGMTHPNGVLPLAGLIFLSLYLDFNRIKLKHILLSFVPYMLGGVGLAWYIAQNPDAFFYQFGAVGSSSPGLSLESFKEEIAKRYLHSFGLRWDNPFEIKASLLSRLKIFTLAGYIIGVIGLISVRELRRNRKFLALFITTVMYFLIMTIFIVNKRFYYLPYITPLFASCLAIFSMWAWRTRFLPRIAVGAAIGGFMLLQTGGDIHRIKKDYYHTRYLPMMSVLKSTAGKDDIIMGSAELAFGLGFSDRLVDDSRLGFYSSIRPDIIVTEPRYRALVPFFMSSEPPAALHITNLMDNEFKQIYADNYYRIYTRK